MFGWRVRRGHRVASQVADHVGNVHFAQDVQAAQGFTAQTGGDVDARMAESWGWVNRVVDDPVRHSLALARRIASFPPHAVREAKASILRNDEGVEVALREESGGFNRLLADPRARAAMTAFLERGGQTVAGEARLGELAGELGE